MIESREHLDVIVVGAGLSGVAAGYYLQTHCPRHRYAILEMRGAIGGTWDLFRYPGIRCDSDMFSLGYPFRPWPRDEIIADGGAIRDYIVETAREFGIDDKIRFHHKLIAASWSSAEARWTLSVERRDAAAPDGEPELLELTARFVISCTGYYSYDNPYTPDFPGRERYQGLFVHPQLWSEDIDYTDKRVVIIGSGATAITMVPAMAERAAKVTMLQRSPGYFVVLGRKDPLAQLAREYLPNQLAGELLRWKNTLLSAAFYEFSRAFPDQSRALLIARVRRLLGDDYDVETHFSPRYKPWDERILLTPDADFFKALESGKAEIVTDHIETLTETGIALRSGQTLDADLIVSATGLNLEMLGGVSASVDGQPVVANEKFFYRGAMLSEVPNFALVLGYTNATWTLKVELTLEYVCRLLARMDERGEAVVCPRRPAPSVEARPLIEMKSGYINRVRDQLPVAGSQRPWKMYGNYVLDRIALRRAPLVDEVLEFRRA